MTRPSDFQHTKADNVKRNTTRSIRFGSIALCALALAAPAASAQAPGGQQGPANAKQAAQFDITGQWVAVVSEDWVYRMVVAPKGDRGSIPINDAAKQVAEQWTPSEGALSCKAYGAIGVMRMPTRMRIAWQDENTLKMDFDAGQQTRLLRFNSGLPPIGYSTSEPPSTFRAPNVAIEPSLSGYSVAAWHKQRQSRGLGFGGPPTQPNQSGALAVVTTHLSDGYLQSNGIPYSSDAVMREFFNLITLPDGSEWLVVTSIVDDPKYLTMPWVTSVQFKRERNADAKWRPTACS
jgi:hypothetical protein